MDIKIRDFKLEDGQGVAELFNLNHYGTIRGAIPLRGDDIRDLWKRKSFICLLVAKENDRVVGSLAFEKECGGKVLGQQEIWGDHLVVHPRMQGGVIPAALFMEGIRRLVKGGYQKIFTEVDLSNSKALFLYKRMGFCRTSLSKLNRDNYIELCNYLPAVIRYVILRFSEKELVRLFPSGIEQGWKQIVPFSSCKDTGVDSLILHGMEMIAYEIRSDDWSGKVLIDPVGGDVCGIETPWFKAACILEEPREAMIGSSFSIKWQIENKMDYPVRITIKSANPRGGQLFKKTNEVILSREEKTFTASILMRDGSDKKIESEITISKPVKKTSKFLIDWGIGHLYKLLIRRAQKSQGEVDPGKLEFLSNVIKLAPEYVFNFKASFRKIIPPLEIDFPFNTRVKQIDQQKIQINFHNNTSKRVKAKILIDGADFKIEKALLLLPGSIANLPFEARFKKTGPASLAFSVFDEEEEKMLFSRRFLLQIVGWGEVFAFQEKEDLVVGNNMFRIYVDLKTGMLNACSDSGCLSWRQKWTDIGPPFEGGFLTPLPRTLTAKIQKGESSYKVSLVEENESFFLTKILKINDSNLISVAHQLKTKARANSIKDIRIDTRSCWGEGKITIPLEEGIVSDPLIENEYPYMKRDFEGVGSDYPLCPLLAESWSSIEKDGDVVGLIWSGKAKELEYINNLPSVVYGAHEHERKIYIYYGKGTWQNIREAWEQLSGEKKKEIPISPVLTCRIKPQVLLVAGGQKKEIEITLINKRARPLKGELSLTPCFPGKVAPSDFQFESLSMEHPAKVSAVLSDFPDKTDSCLMELNMRSDLYLKKWLKPIIVVGNMSGKCEITKERGVYKINNGVFTMLVCPSFRGSIYSISFKGEEQLLSSFPEIKSHGSIYPWWGGIYHYSLRENKPFEANLFQGEIPPEFAVEIKRRAKDGILWEGLSIKAENSYGIFVEVEYLTVFESNLLMINKKFINGSGNINGFNSIARFFLKAGGERKSVFHFIRENEIYHRFCGAQDALISSGQWAAIEPEKGPLAALVTNYGQVKGCDFKNTGLHLSSEAPILLQPKEEKSISDFMVFADSLEKAIIYKVLATWQDHA